MALARVEPCSAVLAMGVFGVAKPWGAGGCSLGSFEGAVGDDQNMIIRVLHTLGEILYIFVISNTRYKGPEGRADFVTIACQAHRVSAASKTRAEASWVGMATRRRSKPSRGVSDSPFEAQRSRQRRSNWTAKRGRGGITPSDIVIAFGFMLFGFALWRRTLGRRVRVPVLKHGQEACKNECWVSERRSGAQVD